MRMIWIVYAESVVWKAQKKKKKETRWMKTKGRKKMKMKTKRKIKRLVSFTFVSF